MKLNNLRVQNEFTRQMAVIVLATALLLTACGGQPDAPATATISASMLDGDDHTVAAVAQAAFADWAATNGEPYRDARLLEEGNDGYFAAIRVLAWFRPSADADWEEREAIIECRQVGKVWQCDEQFNFVLSSGELGRRSATATTAAAPTVTAEAIVQATASAAARATSEARAIAEATRVAEATAQSQATLQANTDALTQRGITWRINAADGAVYIRVPAGEFPMGSAVDLDDRSAHPQHTVYLDEYWIMQTEVTIGQYVKCVEAGACQELNNLDWRGPSQAEMPVRYVTWDQAQAYAQWAGGRLPTEAEWEKAARGTDGRLYPWGNEPPSPERVNCCSFVGEASPVGNFPTGASPYGVMDMAGNVSEWVNDWYSVNYYSASPATNPQGPTRGEYRVVRGGSWGTNEEDIQSTHRLTGYSSHRLSFVGFRCVLSP